MYIKYIHGLQCEYRVVAFDIELLLSLNYIMIKQFGRALRPQAKALRFSTGLKSLFHSTSKHTQGMAELQAANQQYQLLGSRLSQLVPIEEFKVWKDELTLVVRSDELLNT